MLDRVDGATVVPHDALTRRDDHDGVFVVDGTTARWHPVDIGIRDGDRVQLLTSVTGRVVTLGRHLVEDGSAVVLPE